MKKLISLLCLLTAMSTSIVFGEDDTEVQPILPPADQTLSNPSEAPKNEAVADVSEEWTADKVLDKYYQAVGGPEVYANIKTMSMSATLSMEAQKISGDLLIFIKSPNKVYVKTVIPGLMTSVQAYDGVTAWAKDTFFGLRKLKAEEKSQLEMSVLSFQPDKWKQMYDKVEYLGVQTIDGVQAHVLEMKPKTGKPATHYYSAETFYLIRMDAVQESQMGTMPAKIYMSDYADKDGMKYPSKIKTVLSMGEIVMTIDKININTVIDDKLFVMPDENAKSPVKAEPKKPATKTAPKKTTKPAPKKPSTKKTK